MRCDQHMGLPIKAVNFLKENEIAEKCCGMCRRPFPRKLEVIGHCHGMDCAKYPLYRHKLIGGGHADEYLQAQPWSSGPCFFLGLRVGDTVYEWAQETIDVA